MRQDKKLILGMSLFFLFVFVSFGIIITMEKAAPYIIPKIDKKLTNYINKNYKEENLILKNTKYKNTKFEKQVISTKNPNLSFTVFYQDKKISDTYQTDYIKGKKFLKHISKKIQTEIRKQTKETYSITIPTTLDQFTNAVKNKILEEKELSSLRIYNLEKELIITNWTEEEIINKITKFINNLESNGITPKTYTIIITNKNNITDSIEIKNLTAKTINNNELNSLIHDILNNKDINDKNITYKYLN